MTVLSLFDGISCGRVALKRAGLNVKRYYASEIDKYAMQISAKNWPDIIQLGDVKSWKDWDIDWSEIGLVTGGFPCQAWSVAGKQLGDRDERGALFWDMLDIMQRVLESNPFALFLIENVRMKKEFEQYITEHTEKALGKTYKHLINSALVSAQNRQRYYWTNIPNIQQPKDRGIVLADVLEYGLVDREKSYCLDANYWKGGNIEQYKKKRRRQIVFKQLPRGYNKGFKKELDKTPTLSAHSWEHNNFIKVGGCEPTKNKGGGLCKHVASATDIKGRDSIKRVYSPSGKSPTVNTCQGGHRQPKIIIRKKSKTVRSSGRGSYDRHEWDSISDCHYRKLTPLECERLQTLSDNYTEGVSNTQRYKAIGNGWTVDVIAHILSFIKKAN